LIVSLRASSGCVVYTIVRPGPPPSVTHAVQASVEVTQGPADGPVGGEAT
jgi:hypothetical protein